MKKFIRASIDRISLAMLRQPFFDRAASYLSYQHRRVTRRRLETRLRREGLYPDEVQRGPFRGMKYPEGRWASCRFEKIIGTYEHEIHPLIGRIATDKRYATIFNIGSAEGFYTVGLARMFPQARVIAFDAKPENVGFLDEFAKLNAVSSRIDSRGFCAVEDLADRKPEGPVLVFMDIDGGERAVLDPVKIPWLRDADILVELHDCLEPGMTEIIRSRFDLTHLIQQITNAGLEYANFPVLRPLLFTEIHALVGEDRRGLQDWFFMEPR